MTFFRRSVSCRFISMWLIVSMVGMGLPLSAQAGMVATTTVAAEPAKERIVSLIERSDVRAQLQAIGVNPNDAKSRVAALSDAEAAQLTARLDSLPAGGDR